MAIIECAADLSAVRLLASYGAVVVLDLTEMLASHIESGDVGGAHE
jgi:hypothetical protein